MVYLARFFTVPKEVRSLEKRFFSCGASRLLCHSMAAAQKWKRSRQQDLTKVEGKLLIVEGNIAAGKSTFSKRLGECFGFEVNDEPALRNPYLAKFYHEPKKYGLKLQLWLFQQRYLMYIQALKHIIETGQGVILDRSIYSDLVFTNVLHKDGSISSSGYKYYLRVREKAMKNLPAPCAAIYLFTPPGICYKRILKRGRDYEQEIPLLYLEKLSTEHEEIFKCSSITQSFPVLTYDWSEFGRDPNTDSVAPEEDAQFYSYGFNKIVTDIKGIEEQWKPELSEDLLVCDSEEEILKTISSVEGFEQIADEMPQ